MIKISTRPVVVPRTNPLGIQQSTEDPFYDKYRSITTIVRYLFI